MRILLIVVKLSQILLMEAGVDSSTLPVGMKLDSGLLTIARGCCWSSLGGLTLSPSSVLRGGGAQ